MNNSTNNHRTWLRYAGVAVLFFAVGMLFTTGLEWTGTTQADPSELLKLAEPSGSRSGDVQVASNPYTTASIQDTESPFVAVAERLKPSVVNISVLKETGADPHSGMDMDWWREFFGDRGMPMPSPRGPREAPASGTGVIISEKGHVLTNNHVVADASEITVNLADGTEREAEVVGADPDTDLALLIIGDVQDQQVATLGNSSEIRIGDWAIAMGNARNLEWTLTVGVISAKGRSDLRISGGGPVYQDFIQTDAAINFGNSGGPLVNIRGEVIGINTAIDATGQGIGFAIPIDMAKDVVEQLLETGQVSRGYLGMVPSALTSDLKDALDLDENQTGILVESVQPNTPASEGGLEAGDVITELDGKPVEDVSDFRIRVAQHKPGETLKTKIIRDGDSKRLSFELGDRATYIAELTGRRPGGTQRDRDYWMGIRAGSLEQAGRLNLEPEVEDGVLILDVEDDSPADGKLSRGDVIVKIGREEVRGMGDWERITSEIGETDDAVLIRYYRGGRGSGSFVAIKK
jgi:Do/DeqQ family serine protease